MYCKLSSNEICSCCSHPNEDNIYTLRDCPYSKEIWMRMAEIHSLVFYHNNSDICLQAIVRHKDTTRLMIVLWWIWRFRNNHIFEDNKWTPTNICHMINVMVVENHKLLNRRTQVTHNGALLQFR